MSADTRRAEVSWAEKVWHMTTQAQVAYNVDRYALQAMIMDGWQIIPPVAPRADWTDR